MGRRDAMSAPPGMEVERPRAPSTLAPFSWEPTVLKLTSRMGVWGLFAGFGSLLADTAGLLNLGTHLPWVGAAFIVGGLGTFLTSALVLRRTRRSLRRMTFTAALGLPVGIATGILGVNIFLPHFLERTMHVWMVAILILVPVMVVMFGVGVVSKLMFGDRDGDPHPSGEADEP